MPGTRSRTRRLSRSSQPSPLRVTSVAQVVSSSLEQGLVYPRLPHWRTPAPSRTSGASSRSRECQEPQARAQCERQAGHVPVCSVLLTLLHVTWGAQFTLRYDGNFLSRFIAVCKEKPDFLPPVDVIGLQLVEQDLWGLARLLLFVECHVTSLTLCIRQTQHLRLQQTLCQPVFDGPILHTQQEDGELDHCFAVFTRSTSISDGSGIRLPWFIRRVKAVPATTRAAAACGAVRRYVRYRRVGKYSLGSCALAVPSQPSLIVK